ncbi:MAG: transcriptional regulator, partial [Streptomycetaceae bacterium]|nr:transcriptional regulator [Streptomycetaceae bacterium]
MTAGPLAYLAERQATGVLLGAAGALYLRDGDVVHAESPAAPTVDVLLAARGRLTADAWRDAVERAGARRGVARYLVERALLTDGELEICHLGALFDAAYFALAPDAGPCRFRQGAAHWLGPIRPVPAGT